jgi:hypothetical protein
MVSCKKNKERKSQKDYGGSNALVPEEYVLSRVSFVSSAYKMLTRSAAGATFAYKLACNP